MRRITGRPIVFGSTSVDLGGFVEEIDPRAVDRTLSDSRAEVLALRSHDALLPLARRSARSLMLAKDAHGLSIDAAVDDGISYVADLLRLIQRGDAPGGSFGFAAVADEWELRNGLPYRRVLDMIVSEVSLGVVWPAYRETRLEVRAAQQARGRTRRYYDTRIRLAR